MSLATELYLASSPIHGVGVFTANAIARGARFHTAPLIMFPLDDLPHLRRTRLREVLFGFGDLAGLPLSPMALVNHSLQPSARFEGGPGLANVQFISLCAIAAGDEITIDYGPYARVLGL